MKAYEVHTTKSAFSTVSVDAFAFSPTALTTRSPKLSLAVTVAKTYSVENVAAFSDLDCKLTAPIYLVTYIQRSRGLAGC